MKTSLALLYIVIFGVVGFLHGYLYRKVSYWKRAGIYVENDEYRVGFFALTIIFVMYAIRMMETAFVYHENLREGWWPLVWSITFVYCLVIGFSKSTESTLPTLYIPKDTSIPPITGVPDE